MIRNLKEVSHIDSLNVIDIFDFLFSIQIFMSKEMTLINTIYKFHKYYIKYKSSVTAFIKNKKTNYLHYRLLICMFTRQREVA